MITIKSAVTIIIAGLKLPACLAQTFSISFSILEKDLRREGVVTDYLMVV